MLDLHLPDGRPLALRTFATPAELDAALAARIVGDLVGASAAAAASLALSGGRTPLGLFAQLSAAALPWPHIAVTLVDDRWLPEDHADSNAGLVRRALLRDRAASARWLPLVPSDVTDETPKLGGVAGNSQDTALRLRSGQALQNLPSICEAGETALSALSLPLDVCVLGMGNDGHTASLFPCASETAAALRDDAPPLAIVHPASAPYVRISLSLPPLAAARHLYLHIVGATKLDVLRSALAGGSLPIARVLAAARGEVCVFWSPDHA